MKMPSPSPTPLPPGARKKFKKVITGVADHGSRITLHGSRYFQDRLKKWVGFDR